MILIFTFLWELVAYRHGLRLLHLPWHICILVVLINAGRDLSSLLINRIMSSAYNANLCICCLILSAKGSIQSAKRKGDKGSPCRVPVYVKSLWYCTINSNQCFWFVIHSFEPINKCIEKAKAFAWFKDIWPKDPIEGLFCEWVMLFAFVTS